jgi:hypothetical protein
MQCRKRALQARFEDKDGLYGVIYNPACCLILATIIGLSNHLLGTK